MLAILDPGRNVFTGGSVYSGCCTSFTSSLLRWSPHTTRPLLSLAWEGTKQTYAPTHSLHKSSESPGRYISCKGTASSTTGSPLIPLLAEPFHGKSMVGGGVTDAAPGGTNLGKSCLTCQQLDEEDFTKIGWAMT